VSPSAPTTGTAGAPAVLVVGSGWRFTSGISYYTCRLTNALAAVTPTRALLMRGLVPKALYPGRARVGTTVNDLTYVDAVDVYDGVDWFWGSSMRGARRFVQETPPDVLVLQWWTGAVLHSYLRLARLARRAGSRVVIEWHEVQDTGEARIPGVTRAVTTGAVIATDVIGTRVSIATRFRITFVRPVDPGSLRDGIHLDPATPGSVQLASSTEGLTRYAFVPGAPLRAGVEYRLVVDGVRDVDGLALDPFSLVVWTVKAPEVVRFRPDAATRDVVPSATISVRFSDPMDRRATARAFTVSAVGQVVIGKIQWAESDSVLIFTPDGDLPYGASVVVQVGPEARSKAGVPLGVVGKSAFQTAAKPKPVVVKPKPVVVKPPPTPPKPPSTGGGGGTVGGGSWIAVERYYLGLMNCTRTGGWVSSSGSCSAPGSRAVAALRLDSGISSQVSRPYAKQLAVGNDCSHFLDGNPGDRLRRAGFSSYRWAENIGCQSGSPMSVVLSSHLFFQSEKSSLGGHYVNLMNAQYDRVGIGVWVSSGRVRLVVDFYHP